MKKKLQRWAILAAIAIAAAVSTVSLSQFQFFKMLNLKAQDTHFVLRGRMPYEKIADYVIIGVDEKTLNSFPELSSFWHKYYADAIRGAADGGAKVMVLDKTFGIPVSKWEPDYDAYLAEAYLYAMTAGNMPVICAYVPEAMGSQSDARFAVNLNMAAASMGTWSMANLTADSDDFVRRQELIEEPHGRPTDQLIRFMSLRAAEKLVGKDVEFRKDGFFLGNTKIPDRTITINYAGPQGTFPRVSFSDFVNAARKHDTAQLEKWVKGKAVLLGPDNGIEDRYSTPYYTAFGSGKWTTPGVEIHANTLRTLMSGEFLVSVPDWVRYTALLIDAILCVVAVSTLAVNQTIFVGIAGVFFMVLSTHMLFRAGLLMSTSEMLVSFLLALAGGIVFRFATAEKKSTFFKAAMTMFVGKEVTKSLDESDVISLTGDRTMVTILFTDIRGFTAFCESKDPAEVVDLLNVYMRTMVSVIVKYHGHVNKFIGDGILAVFSDRDEGSKPGDHALRCVRCATEIVKIEVGAFKTGAGMHSGEVVIGNVGSSDKMEFTVLGDTVNLASRLESLNKEQKTKLLMSGTTHEMLQGAVDTFFIGTVPVRGKTEPMKLFSVLELIPEERRLAAAQAEAHEAEVKA
jgi:adenylate cyclase